eukprot:1182438-Prorocentrum_minimum.AAC.1
MARVHPSAQEPVSNPREILGAFLGCKTHDPFGSGCGCGEQDDWLTMVCSQGWPCVSGLHPGTRSAPAIYAHKLNAGVDTGNPTTSSPMMNDHNDMFEMDLGPSVERTSDGLGSAVAGCTAETGPSSTR